MKKIFSFLLILFLFCACNKKSVETKTSTDSSKVVITASFYPIYIMLLNLCENAENVELRLLAPSNTGCLHDYELTTRDMKSISDSDILVLNGLGMESFLDKALEMKKGSAIVASEGFEISSEEINPHLWVGISGAIYEVQKIAEKLMLLNPQNASIYRSNLSNYSKKLEELKQKMHSEMDKFSGKTIVTFHEAFPYFAEEFNLKIASVIEREPGTVPSPKELNEIIETVKRVNAEENTFVPLFAEPQYSSSSAEVISKSTGSKIYELDPCVTGELSKDSYISSMEKNLEVLKSVF